MEKHNEVITTTCDVNVYLENHLIRQIRRQAKKNNLSFKDQAGKLLELGYAKETAKSNIIPFPANYRQNSAVYNELKDCLRKVIREERKPGDFIY